MKHHSIIGNVKRVDLVSRELHVQTGTSLVVFDVPSDCPILLRYERVKLRLMQSGDRVSINFIQSGHRRVAILIHAQPIHWKASRAPLLDSANER